MGRRAVREPTHGVSWLEGLGPLRGNCGDFRGPLTAVTVPNTAKPNQCPESCGHVPALQGDA